MARAVGDSEWSERELRALSRMWPTQPKSMIYSVLKNRTPTAIERKAADLGVGRSRRIYQKRAPETIDAIFRSLRAIRESRKMTRPELAEILGCHPQTIAFIENGETRPSWLMFRAWLDALECDLRIIERCA